MMFSLRAANRAILPVLWRDPLPSEEGATAAGGFSRRFIRPDYRLSSRPATGTPGILMLSRNNPGLAAGVNEDIRLGNAYADALHKCEAKAARTGKAARRTLEVQPYAR